MDLVSHARRVVLNLRVVLHVKIIHIALQMGHAKPVQTAEAPKDANNVPKDCIASMADANLAHRVVMDHYHARHVRQERTVLIIPGALIVQNVELGHQDQIVLVHVQLDLIVKMVRVFYVHPVRATIHVLQIVRIANLVQMVLIVLRMGHAKPARTVVKLGAIVNVIQIRHVHWEHAYKLRDAMPITHVRTDVIAMKMEIVLNVHVRIQTNQHVQMLGA